MESVAFIAEYKFLFVIIHVLSVVLGMGAALTTDVLSVRFGFDRKLTTFETGTIRFLSHVVTFALVGIICTGALVFLSDPERYLNSAKFLTKMTVVSVLCINGYLLHRFVFSRLSERGILTSKKARALRKLAFALGAVSVVSWVTALALGVLITISTPYGIAIGIYGAVLLIAIMLSQIVESTLLERKQNR